MEAATRQRTRLINQLHGMLARVFPELSVSVTDVSAGWVLTLLDKYPTPEKLSAAKPEVLARIPRLSLESAHSLKTAAAQSVGSNRGPIAEQLIRQKVRAIRIQEAESQKLQMLLEMGWNALPEGPHRRLQTIKGIGLQTAAAS